MSLREQCLRHTFLPSGDIRLLEQAAAAIQHTADLTGADVFIDCMGADGKTAVVVAEAKPGGGLSAYGKTVLGKAALPDREPAVYHAFRTGLVIRDLKAVTQEDIVVRQDVAPIKNHEGVVIGVLIREKDVSRSLRQEEKYQQLARERENRNGILPSVGDGKHDLYELQMREVHHRVKNNLQLIASILNIQARRQNDEQIVQILRDTVGKVLSIAAIHDIMTTSFQDSVELLELLSKLRDNLAALGSGGKDIRIEVFGDRVAVPPDRASSIALAVHELVINAMEHAFPHRDGGLITVVVRGGGQYSSVMVEDNGGGFLHQQKPDRLGLGIISEIVRDKLGGEIQFSTGEHGTKAMFDFRITE